MSTQSQSFMFEQPKPLSDMMRPGWGGHGDREGLVVHVGPWALSLQRAMPPRSLHSLDSQTIPLAWEIHPALTPHILSSLLKGKLSYASTFQEAELSF